MSRAASAAARAVLRPVIKKPKRSFNLSERPCIPNAATRTAANSSAKGRPSSLRQISQSAGASSSVRRNSTPLANARSLNSCTAEYSSASRAVISGRSGGTSSDPKRCSHSPSARSGSRLVASIRTRDAVFSMASTLAAASSITCSQLSSTTPAGPATKPSVLIMDPCRRE